MSNGNLNFNVNGNLNFNANAVDPDDGFNVLPAGEYRVCVTKAVLADTKKKDGKIVKVSYQVLDQGRYFNRLIFEDFNFANPSAQATAIGKAQLSSLCRACQVMNLNDTSDLLQINGSKPFVVKVKVKREEGFGEKNVVVTRKKIVKPAGQPNQPQEQQQQQQPNDQAGSAAAWAGEQQQHGADATHNPFS